ncbi:MAG: twin-arginine translocase TatA/TatE family subunit [Acidobacteriota bacterium]|nr:twin-arginine translocase TatA/TatE family subunit [Acidobacteriota bacterium]
MMFLLGPVGPTELILILLIVIIIFGAKKLPDLGKSLGEGIKNFKKSMSHKDREDQDSASPKDEPPTN